jgi:hypothetical protein
MLESTGICTSPVAPLSSTSIRSTVLAIFPLGTETDSSKATDSLESARRGGRNTPDCTAEAVDGISSASADGGRTASSSCGGMKRSYDIAGGAVAEFSEGRSSTKLASIGVYECACSVFLASRVPNASSPSTMRCMTPTLNAMNTRCGYCATARDLMVVAVATRGFKTGTSIFSMTFEPVSNRSRRADRGERYTR